MKFQIMIDILFILLDRRKVTADFLASRFGIATRTIYRYLDEMTIAGIPIDITRGFGGGISIPDSFKLPKGLLTREELQATVDALETVNRPINSETLSSVIGKLTAQYRNEARDTSFYGNVLIDASGWGDGNGFDEKLAIVNRAVEEREKLQITYFSNKGEVTKRVILPHLLVFKQNNIYAFCWCELREQFRLFHLGRIGKLVPLGIRFTRKPFERKDIPLDFTYFSDDRIEASFEISPSSLHYMEEWLGASNITQREGKFFSQIVLPDDDALIGKILCAGAGVKVLAPESLKQRLKEESERLFDAYHSS